MKRLFVLTYIILILCFITGCRQPIGTLTENSNGGNGIDLEILLVYPNRLLYETYDRFEPSNDLQILVAEEGLLREVLPSDPRIIIEITENPGLTSETTSVVSTHFPFSLPGRHIINVKYNNENRHYSVEVRGTYQGGGDGSDFLDIVWL